jgi:hypothetical protein
MGRPYFCNGECGGAEGERERRKEGGKISLTFNGTLEAVEEMLAAVATDCGWRLHLREWRDWGFCYSRTTTQLT